MAKDRKIYEGELPKGNPNWQKRGSSSGSSIPGWNDEFRSRSTADSRRTASGRNSLGADAVARQAENPTGLPPGSFRGTVIYVHGIANKPTVSVLKCQWDQALFGYGMGEKSRMVYWVNRMRHGPPSPGTCSDSDFSQEASRSFTAENSRRTESMGAEAAEAAEISGMAEEIYGQNEEARFTLKRIARKMLDESLVEDTPAFKSEAQYRAEVLPLPRPIRQWIARQVTWAFLSDVYDYMYDTEFSTRVDALFRERILGGRGPFLVIGHSLGSVIAYKNLVRLFESRELLDVPLFLTIGSPLGLQEIQDQLKKDLGKSRLAIPGCVRSWVNMNDWLDPVSADRNLANDFDGNSLVDVPVSNPDGPRHPHSATGYLSTPEVRNTVREVTGSGFAQEITQFVIARDLVDKIEESAHLGAMSGSRAESNLPPPNLQEVLIEIRRNGDDSFKEGKQRILEALRSICQRKNPPPMVLARYVAAQMTPVEIEQLAGKLGESAIQRVWSDSQKFALMKTSSQTVHAYPAARSYSADGDSIRWAVLDTGIRPDHPHFKLQTPSTVEAIWDCTREGGEPVAVLPGDRRGLDHNGHGTHVAGIIAGGSNDPVVQAQGGFLPSMGTHTRIHAYKVLGDDGAGRDSWIIKALDHIAKVNREAPNLVIHGVNLSLGGPFDPRTYGCGHTPICRELLRLWRQGVLVVLSAGNSGFAELQSSRGMVQANMDLSIGDPANLDEAISVGSVHKQNPWTYGVSFFSSRGPTADGRCKPDLVAPGEKIASAHHGFVLGDTATYYIELSGTSMAAPHVSGILASFLSRRQEFIGRPDQVKRILLDNCTSIGRDPYHQGAGIPNLVKMLSST